MLDYEGCTAQGTIGTSRCGGKGLTNHFWLSGSGLPGFLGSPCTPGAEVPDGREPHYEAVVVGSALDDHEGAVVQLRFGRGPPLDEVEAVIVDGGFEAAFPNLWSLDQISWEGELGFLIAAEGVACGETTPTRYDRVTAFEPSFDFVADRVTLHLDPEIAAAETPDRGGYPKGCQEWEQCGSCDYADLGFRWVGSDSTTELHLIDCRSLQRTVTDAAGVVTERCQSALPVCLTEDAIDISELTTGWSVSGTSLNRHLRSDDYGVDPRPAGELFELLLGDRVIAVGDPCTGSDCEDASTVLTDLIDLLAELRAQQAAVEVCQ